MNTRIETWKRAAPVVKALVITLALTTTPSGENSGPSNPESIVSFLVSSSSWFGGSTTRT